MDKVKSVFDFDEFGDPIDKSAMDEALDEYVQSQLKQSLLKRCSMAHLHKILSEPRELDDEDFCVREGYRDVLSQFRELQMAGRVLAQARAEQYDPEGVEDVDPTTRMDYDVFQAADDVRRVSERLKSQSESAKAPETSATDTPAPEAPAPEAPSSSAQ